MSKELIEQFYTAFRNKDFKTMQSCYHPDAHFHDPAFGDLNAEEVKAMWQMLIERGGENLEVSLENIMEGHGRISASWKAEYLFGPKKRKVVNRINGNFLIKDGLILDHKDEFYFKL